MNRLSTSLRTLLRAALGPVALAGLLALGAGPGRAQDVAPTPTRQEPEAVLTRDTLQNLAESIAEKQAAVDAARDALASATTEEARLQHAREMTEAQAEVDQLQRNFAAIALGANVSALLAEQEQELDLTAELQRLLEPLIQELKDATEEPRQISALKSQIELHDARVETIRRGIRRLDAILTRVKEESGESELTRQLVLTRQRWSDNQRDEQARADVARAQLQQRLEARTSLLDSSRDFLRRFFSSQGLTLILGLLAFAGVLFGMRLLYRPIRRVLMRRHRGEKPFYARLLAALFYIATSLLAVIATLLVFWAAGDWVLLGLALIFLLGLAWASRQTLPRYVEQVRLFLNIGSVREGERVVVDGVAYRVESINLFTRLVNDDLSGGTLRMPIQDLIGRRSRRQAPREPWFPCDEGDWVLLSDGTRGKVLVQTPEFVQLVLLGGARQTWTTSDFLAAAPRNLSAGFRVAVTFGIDYAHQPICTTEIPAKMRAKLETDLAALIGDEQVVNIGVEFKEAGASSLDYAVLADFAGSVAVRYDMLHRAIQRSLVDACNENGWVIPFTQVTVHQANG